MKSTAPRQSSQLSLWTMSTPQSIQVVMQYARPGRVG